MKKTLLTASLLLAISLGAQAATTTYFHNLTESTDTKTGLTFSHAESGFSTITATSSDNTSALFSSNSGDQLSTAITFTFNLTAVENALTTSGASLTLVSIDLNPSNSTNTYSAGFTITRQDDGTYNAYLSSGTNGTFENIRLIEADIASDFLSGSNSYATFTLTTGKIKTPKVGFSAYDAEGNPVVDTQGQATGYMSAYNTGLDSIRLDAAYVTAAAITPKSLTDASEIAAISKAIPEPTTATLSLLALAGLAARRRRK